MQPRRLANLIRRAGQPFTLLNGGQEVTRFSAVLNSSNTCLSVSELPLEIGAIVSPVSRPNQKYIIIDSHNVKHYSDHVVRKINTTGSISRYSGDTAARDTFGRPISADLVMVYSDVPLVMHDTGTDSQHSPDRSGSTASCEFTTSDTYTYSIQLNDRLTLSNDQALVVTALIPAPAGLTRFQATVCNS